MDHVQEESVPEDETDMRKGPPLEGKQLWAALLAALAFFGYLAAVTIFSGNSTMRLILVGPYGVSAMLWFGVPMSILIWKMRRETKRSGDQKP